VKQVDSAQSAALIPNGRLAVLGGDDFFGGEEAAAAIEGFVAELRSTSQPVPAGAPSHDLSAREKEVLKLLAAGRSNQQIAEDLVISLNTVTRHVSNVYAKTGVANRAQAAVYARDRGLA
jgi:DNA-binding NarL/FixJ family response regulator